MGEAVAEGAMRGDGSTEEVQAYELNLSFANISLE